MEKWLPLSLSGEILFERVDNGYKNKEISMRLRKILKNLFYPCNDDDDGDTNEERIKGNIRLLSVIQTHLISSVLGRDITSRRPAMDLLLWYVQSLLEKVNQQMKNREATLQEELKEGTPPTTPSTTDRTNYLWLTIASKELVPSLLVSMRVILKKGWIVKLENISLLIGNMSSMFTSLCVWDQMQQHQQQQQENEKKRRSNYHLTLLVANLASEICNRILIQFKSVQQTEMRHLLQGPLFQGGLQVDLTKFNTNPNNNHRNNTIPNRSPNGVHESPLSRLGPSPLRMKSTPSPNSSSGSGSGSGSARALRSPPDPLTPPRLRRMSSVVDEDHLLRTLLDGNSASNLLQREAKKTERRGIQMMRDRMSGPLVDRAERAVAGALIKHCGMLVETHDFVKRMKTYDKKRKVAKRSHRKREGRKEEYHEGDDEDGEDDESDEEYDEVLKKPTEPVPPTRLVTIFQRARTIRDWLRRAKERQRNPDETSLTKEMLCQIVIGRASLLLKVKPSNTSFPRIANAVPLTITQRGVRLQEHLASIRQRRESRSSNGGIRQTTSDNIVHPNTPSTDVATEVLLFCTNDDLNNVTNVANSLRIQQQCAIVRILTLSHLERLFTTSRRYSTGSTLPHQEDMLRPLILPVINGLRKF